MNGMKKAVVCVGNSGDRTDPAVSRRMERIQSKERLGPPHNTARCQPLSLHPTRLSEKSNQVNLTRLTSSPSQGSSGAAAPLSLKH